MANPGSHKYLLVAVAFAPRKCLILQQHQGIQAIFQKKTTVPKRPKRTL